MIQEIIQPSAWPYAATSAVPASAPQVQEACSALGVSASGFYAHRHKAERPRRRQDEVLADAIKSIFEDSRRTYGSPRLVRALRERGLRTSKTRVTRLMKRHGLCPRQKLRSRIQTTCSSPHLPAAPHLLLDAPPATKPGERFYSDITYIPTQEGWLFTAATMDAYSRKCAGWSAADNMETPLVLRAAQRAFGNAAVNADVDADVNATIVDVTIHHSDRGSQYASEMFREFLQDHQVTQSMSRQGNCYDNAAMESFWATVKTECFDNFRHGMPATRQAARQQLFSYIEVFYNRQRLHSALGYQAPVQFEQNYRQQQNPQKEENLSFSVST